MRCRERPQHQPPQLLRAPQHTGATSQSQAPRRRQASPAAAVRAGDMLSKRTPSASRTTPQSKPASGRHSPPGPPTQKRCEPQNRGASHLTPFSPQEGGPLPKPPCRLEMLLPERTVTQWPDRCPKGRCWGGTNASSAHVTPWGSSWGPTSPHGGPLPP